MKSSIRTFKLVQDGESIAKYVAHLQPNHDTLSYYGSDTDDQTQELSLSAPIGITIFQYENIEMCYRAIESEKAIGLSYKTVKHIDHTLSFECDSMTNAINIFAKFIKDVDLFMKNKKKGFISINMYSVNGGWEHLSDLPTRPMSTIYIEESKKTKMIQDLEDFYKSEHDYKKFGIPYTRKYLFTGPPGVGKTSFIFSLASMMNKDIHTINFNNELDDISLMRAINDIDDDSFLIFEDIDSIFNMTGEYKTSSVTFSGLLNTLDGFGRKTGLVIFMTTNNFKKLEKSFLRPGRIDMMVKFENPTREEINEMFKNFFPYQLDKFHQLYRLIEKKIPSVALLQKFFFENRKCPNILEKIDELIKLINEYSKTENTMFI